MQVQSANNAQVGFKSNKIQRAAVLVNMNDSDLKNLALDYSYNEHDEKKYNKSIAKTFLAIPIVDCIARGIISPELTAKSPLSARAGEMGKAAKGWAGILAVIGAFNLLKNGVVSNSPNLQEFNQKHPVLSLITDIGVISAAVIFGKKGLDKLVAKSPKLIINAGKKIAKLKRSLDKSSFNKKIMPKLVDVAEKFETKMPWAAKAGKIALANSMLILLGAAIVKSIKHTKKANEKIEKNYGALKKEQFQAAKFLAAEMGVERDVMAQNKKTIANDLRSAMNYEE